MVQLSHNSPHQRSVARSTSTASSVVELLTEVAPFTKDFPFDDFMG